MIWLSGCSASRNKWVVLIRNTTARNHNNQLWVGPTTRAVGQIFLSSASTATTTQQSKHAGTLTALGKESSSSDSSSDAAIIKARLLPAWIKSSALAFSCLAVGFWAGQAYKPNNHHHSHHHHHDRVLPNGLPRTCCEETDKESESNPGAGLTKEQQELPFKLQRIVGQENILDGRVADTTTLPFLKGARIGQGSALCIVTPEKLQDVVDVVQLVVDADCVVLPQGQNTGLTGGSVPAAAAAFNNNNHDNRPVVVLSFRKLDRLFPLDDGNRVVCLAGTGLASLQHFLKTEFPHRESHSVLGSTFLNPTTGAGVALGSGGTQVRKGPAYTDRVLYLTVNETKWGERHVQLHSTLGIKGFQDDDVNDGAKHRKLDSVASTIDRWSRLIDGGYERTMRYSDNYNGETRAAHDVTYTQRLCQWDDTTGGENDDNNKNANDGNHHQISRFNADTRGCDANRSEGKVIILATVHDTFPVPQQTKTFWISFDSLDTALAFRRQVCLDNATDVPISMEYMDHDAYTVIDEAGRVLANTIWLVGTTSPILRQLWNVKLWMEALPFDGAHLWVDRVLYWMNALHPPSLSRPIRQMAQTYRHHVALTVGEFGNGELNRFLERMERFQQQQEVSENNKAPPRIQVHECVRSSDVQSLSAFRFAAAPAFRTYCVGRGLQGFSVDYALPKSKGQVPPLVDPSSAAAASSSQHQVPVKRMRYSHFGCNVVHEDLAYDANANIDQAKYALKQSVEKVMGGRLPSEHGHGREYVAPPDTQERWKRMDPLNVLNPGIGGLSHKYRYQSE